MSAAGNTALAAVALSQPDAVPSAAAPPPAAVPLPVAVPPAADSVSVGALRAGLTLLVLAHHAALAYHPDAPPAPASLLTQPRWWGAFPVVDPARWAPVRLFAGFNDTFFMALLFLVSGLFVWQGLVRSGSAAFLRRRGCGIAVAGTVAIAWGATAVLRRIPAVARVI